MALVIIKAHTDVGDFNVHINLDDLSWDTPEEYDIPDVDISQQVEDQVTEFLRRFDRYDENKVPERE